MLVRTPAMGFRESAVGVLTNCSDSQMRYEAKRIIKLKTQRYETYKIRRTK